MEKWHLCGLFAILVDVVKPRTIDTLMHRFNRLWQ